MIPIGIPIIENNIRYLIAEKLIVRQFLDKIRIDMKNPQKATIGEAIFNSKNSASKGMAIRASPKPKVERTRAAKKITMTKKTTVISIINQYFSKLVKK
jgi:hypothetical protein